MVDKRFTKVCLDANIILKLLTEEKESDLVTKIFRRFIRDKLTIIEPNFSKIEIYSIVRKKVSLGQIPESKVSKILRLFNKLNFEYRVEDKKILNKAYKQAERLKERVVYDSTYLKLARLEKAAFITSDKRFLKKAKKVYKLSFSPIEAIEIFSIQA